jgi:hypothetical protein
LISTFQELGYGTLGGVYTTVEGLLQKIEQSLRYNLSPPSLSLLSLISHLRDSNPFLLGDSSKLHHDDNLREAKVISQAFPLSFSLSDE